MAAFLVDENFFDLYGIKLKMGRLPVDNDDDRFRKSYLTKPQSGNFIYRNQLVRRLKGRPKVRSWV